METKINISFLNNKFWSAFFFNTLSLLSICFFYKYNPIVFISLFLIFLGVVSVRKSRFKFFLGFFALFVGVTMEYGFCYYNWWIYANPTIGGLPIWLPFTWVIIMITSGELSDFIEKALRQRLSSGVYQTLILFLAALFFAYAFFTFAHISRVLSYIFGGILICVVIFGHRPFNVIYFYTTAFMGSVGEIICMKFGVWYYTAPYFVKLGIPLSLPLAWGLSANIIWILAMALSRRSLKHETGFESSS